MQSSMTERDSALLRSLISSAKELEEAFERMANSAGDIRIRDELQKLAASAKNHQNSLNVFFGG